MVLHDVESQRVNDYEQSQPVAGDNDGDDGWLGENAEGTSP